MTFVRVGTIRVHLTPLWLTLACFSNFLSNSFDFVFHQVRTSRQRNPCLRDGIDAARKKKKQWRRSPKGAVVFARRGTLLELLHVRLPTDGVTMVHWSSRETVLKCTNGHRSIFP